MAPGQQPHHFVLLVWDYLPDCEVNLRKPTTGCSRTSMNLIICHCLFNSSITSNSWASINTSSNRDTNLLSIIFFTHEHWTFLHQHFYFGADETHLGMTRDDCQLPPVRISSSVLDWANISKREQNLDIERFSNIEWGCLLFNPDVTFFEELYVYIRKNPVEFETLKYLHLLSWVSINSLVQSLPNATFFY